MIWIECTQYAVLISGLDQVGLDHVFCAKQKTQNKGHRDWTAFSLSASRDFISSRISSATVIVSRLRFSRPRLLLAPSLLLCDRDCFLLSTSRCNWDGYPMRFALLLARWKDDRAWRTNHGPILFFGILVFGILFGR